MRTMAFTILVASLLLSTTASALDTGGSTVSSLSVSNVELSVAATSEIIDLVTETNEDPHPKSCSGSVNGGTGECKFSCAEGDEIGASAAATGAVFVNASCGGASTQCWATAAGDCDVVVGRPKAQSDDPEGICQATGARGTFSCSAS